MTNHQLLTLWKATLRLLLTPDFYHFSDMMSFLPLCPSSSEPTVNWRTLFNYLWLYFLTVLVNFQSSHPIPSHKPPAWLEITCPWVKHLPLPQSIVARLISDMLLNMGLNGKDLPILGGGWEHGSQAHPESHGRQSCISVLPHYTMRPSIAFNLMACICFCDFRSRRAEVCICLSRCVLCSYFCTYF